MKESKTVSIPYLQEDPRQKTIYLNIENHSKIKLKESLKQAKNSTSLKNYLVHGFVKQSDEAKWREEMSKSIIDMKPSHSNLVPDEKDLPKKGTILEKIYANKPTTPVQYKRNKEWTQFNFRRAQEWKKLYNDKRVGDMRASFIREKNYYNSYKEVFHNLNEYNKKQNNKENVNQNNENDEKQDLEEFMKKLDDTQFKSPSEAAYENNQLKLQEEKPLKKYKKVNIQEDKLDREVDLFTKEELDMMKQLDPEDLKQILKLNKKRKDQGQKKEKIYQEEKPRKKSLGDDEEQVMRLKDKELLEEYEKYVHEQQLNEYLKLIKENPYAPKLIHHSKQNGYIARWSDATNAIHPKVQLKSRVS